MKKGTREKTQNSGSRHSGNLDNAANAVYAEREQLKKIIEILKETLLHYQTIAELSQDCIFIIDREGYVQYANCSAARHLGSSTPEVIGRPMKTLFPRRTFELQNLNIQSVLASGQSMSVEESVCFPGFELPMNTHLIPIKNKEGEVISVLCISRDETGMRVKQGFSATGTARPSALLPPAYPSPLTGRETEVLRLIASGFTNRRIAAHLSISPKTVETHRTRIMQKLDVHTTAELVRRALLSRMIE